MSRRVVQVCRTIEKHFCGIANLRGRVPRLLANSRRSEQGIAAGSHAIAICLVLRLYDCGSELVAEGGGYA
ncbi:hypothetical protein JAG53_002069 [Proteus mirabilis]|nr:hypothetical protein [Proteus mirabilis]